MSAFEQSARSAIVLVDTLFEIVDSQCWDDLSYVLAEDSVYLRPGYEPFVGLKRIKRFYRFERVAGAGRHHLERVIGDGDAAAGWGRFIGESRTGEPLDERFSDTYEIRGDKIVSRRTHFFRPAI